MVTLDDPTLPDDGYLERLGHRGAYRELEAALVGTRARRERVYQDLEILAEPPQLRTIPDDDYLERLGRRAAALGEREARREILATAAANLNTLFPERF